MARHRDLLESAGRLRALPHLPGRRAGHRRPDRAQPGDRRRIDLPGRPVRGPLGRVRRRRRRDGDPVVVRRADRGEHRVPRGPLHDRGRRRRDPHRDPRPDPTRLRQRLREGRAARRRLGRRRRRRLPRRRRVARSPTPASAWPRSAPTSSGPPPPRTSSGADRLPRSSSRRRLRPPPRAATPCRTNGDRRTTSGTWPRSSRCGPCAAPLLERRDRRHDDAGDHDGERRRGDPRRRAPAAARPLPPRRARPHRHALGLRHVELRHVRGVDGRRAGEELHRPHADGGRPQRSGPSRTSSRTACSTRSSRASSRSTASSAASAPRG